MTEFVTPQGQCPLCGGKHVATIAAKGTNPNLVVHFAICSLCGVAYQEPPISESEAIAYEEEWGWGRPQPYRTSVASDKRAKNQ